MSVRLNAPVPVAEVVTGTATSPKKPQYRIAKLLIELGADLEAEDELGRTPLAVAMLQGDLEAMRLLMAAGAKEPETAGTRAASTTSTSSSSAAGSRPRARP